MTVYNPAEDSFLMSESLKKYLKEKIKDKQINKKIKILDIGTGSGIQAKTCRELGFKNILTADINPEAVKLMKKNKFKSVQSDLFSNLKDKKFSLIIFNPPYLPENKYDKEPDTTGGRKGYEIILRFLKQAKFHLENNGEILILFSSLSKPRTIKKQAKHFGYNIRLVNKMNVSFERLFVYLLN